MVALLLSTWRRTWPQMSSGQLIEPPAVLKLRGPDEGGTMEEPVVDPEGLFSCVRPKLAVMVGQKPACDSRTSALACSTAAPSSFTVRFETSIWSSSPFNTSSLKMCHHGPRVMASAGSVGFQPSCSL